MSFATIRYTPERRPALVSLLERVGTTQLTDEEFAWWFDRNPAGEGIVSLAVDGDEVVGVAAMSFFRVLLDGVETRLAIPGERRNRRAVPGSGRLLDARARERGGCRRGRLPADGDVPERELVPDLREAPRLDRPSAASALGAAAAGVGGGAVRARAAGRAGRYAPARLRRRGRSRGFEVRPVERFGAGDGRARQARGGGLREPLRARRRVLQLALPRLASRLPLLRRVPERGARRRRRRRAHVQARRLGGVPRRPRRRAGREGGDRVPCSAGGRRGEGRRGRARAPAASRVRPASRAPPGRLRPDEQEAPVHRQGAPRRRADRRARRTPGTSRSATSTSSR